MSSKKLKKEKKFRCYPEMFVEIESIRKEMGLDITEVVETSVAFFLKCPQGYRERMYRHYQRCVVDWICKEDDKIGRLLADAPPLEEKENNEKRDP